MPTKSLPGLSLLDFLYALPVADLAMRVSGAQWRRVPMASWGCLAVSVAVIILSWIGYHQNRHDVAAMTGRGDIGEFGFWDLRFVQFLIEIAIIGVYFLLGLGIDLPTEGRGRGKDHVVEQSSALWPASFLVVIFVLYLAWDCLDIRIASKNKKGIASDKAGLGATEPWREHARCGRKVTLAFLVWFAVVLLVVLLWRPVNSGTIFAVDVILILSLYVYRVIQGKRCPPPLDTVEVPSVDEPVQPTGVAGPT